MLVPSFAGSTSTCHTSTAPGYIARLLRLIDVILQQFGERVYYARTNYGLYRLSQYRTKRAADGRGDDCARFLVCQKW